MFKVKLLRGAPPPQRAHPLDAGWDVYFWPSDGLPVALHPGQVAALETGLCVQLPEGTEGTLRGRSGYAFRDEFWSPHTGTIDASYRGEIMALVQCMKSPGPIKSRAIFISPGERIAQLIIHRIWTGAPEIVSDLDPSDRGENGLGSTGR